MEYCFDIHQIDYGKLNREQLNKVNKHNALVEFLYSNAGENYTPSKLDKECDDCVKLLKKDTYFIINEDLVSKIIYYKDSNNYLHNIRITSYRRKSAIITIIKM